MCRQNVGQLAHCELSDYPRKSLIILSFESSKLKCTEEGEAQVRWWLVV